MTGVTPAGRPSQRALSAYGPIKYYRHVMDRMGTASTADSFRLFLAPRMFHCGGGPGPSQFEALTAMEALGQRRCGAGRDACITTERP